MQPTIQTSKWVKLPTITDYKEIEPIVAKKSVNTAVEYKAKDAKMQAQPVPSESLLGNGMSLTSRRSGLRRIVRAKGRKGKKGKARGSTRTPSLPPELEITPILGHTFRFRNTADVVSQSFTVGNLIGICGGIGSIVNSTVASIASSVKLRRVTIWPSTEAESGTDHNPEISFVTAYGTTSDRSFNKSVPGGLTVSAPLTAKPKSDTLASMWQNSSASSSTLFYIYDLPKNSVIDVDVSFCLRNAQGGLNFTVTTAVLGASYYLYLDGSSTHIFQPVALPNTY
jgi:hypothetical protein